MHTGVRIGLDFQENEFMRHVFSQDSLYKKSHSVEQLGTP
jgi:hypothetical protein